jgi:hypothetical protein
MKSLCADLLKSFGSIRAWDSRANEADRLIKVADDLENSDIKDLGRWQEVSRDLSRMINDMDKIKSALEADITKLTRIITEFEHTFVVSVYG